MAEQDNEKYWAKFYADVDATIDEWREKYDPDDELTLLELIEAATGPFTFGDIAAIPAALDKLADEDVLAAMEAR